MIYGYVRISTKKQSLERQIINIIKFEKNAKIIKEIYTGTSTNRKNFLQLLNKVKSNDTIIFDSVSRMSRSAKDGIEIYERLMDEGVNLIFLKEGYINTDIYNSQLETYKNIDTKEKDLKPLFEGIRETLKNLARKQIKVAFDQSEKEVEDMRCRTKEALAVKKSQGVILGRPLNSKKPTKKFLEAKKIIEVHHKKFGGNLKNIEVARLCNISDRSFYKYLKVMLDGKEEKYKKEHGECKKIFE
ncbi:MAG: recombinase family protein [Psychrilyobacter sp.]|uniref:recombinase family protein n=1 Tax=Psychrilyobacter sp. TaxID=2586924 RepID=UPI003C7865CD